MVSLLGIIVGISLVLAIMVTSAVIGVCLLIGWLTGNGMALRGSAQRGPRGGGGRHGNQPAPFSGPQQQQQRPQERFRAGR